MEECFNNKRIFSLIFFENNKVIISVKNVKKTSDVFYSFYVIIFYSKLFNQLKRLIYF